MARGPNFPIDTPVRALQAREYLALGKAAMARALRLSDSGGRDAVRRYENGEGAIPGPSQLAYEYLVTQRREEERKGKRCPACGVKP